MQRPLEALNRQRRRVVSIRDNRIEKKRDSAFEVVAVEELVRRDDSYSISKSSRGGKVQHYAWCFSLPIGFHPAEM